MARACRDLGANSVIENPLQVQAWKLYGEAALRQHVVKAVADFMRT